MKFLRVLCVVFYLWSGVSAHAYNENSQYYNNFDAQRDGNIQSNIAPNSGINWQMQTEEKERNRLINSRHFNSIGDSRQESLNNSPEYDNLQRMIHLNKASIGSNNMGQQQSFHQDQIHPSYINSYQDIRSNENRVNEQEANRRENILQGFPSEYAPHQPIKNMNTQPLRAQEFVSSSMLNDARLINKQNQINDPRFISRDISRVPLNLRDFSSEQPQLVQNINEIPLKKQENILHMLPDSRYINTLPIKQTNELLLKPRDDISEYIKHQPIQNIKKGEINSKPIINQPILKQEEETRLELEGISPEYIESLINQKVHESLPSTTSLQNSYQNINTPLKVTEELNNNRYNLRNQQIDKISTFQNPSAEILYKMQKALPYETELPSPGDNNLKSIINNLERGLEFHTSPSSNKRYMVIHPNGNVEYVDQIAKIIENHPNYIMVKSEDYLKHLEERSKMLPMPFIPQIKQNLPVSSIQTAATKQEYNGESHNLPEIELAQASSITKNPAPYLDSSLIASIEKQDFTPSTTALETNKFKKSPLASLIVNTVATTSPQQIIEQENVLSPDSQNITVSSILTPIEASTENTKNKSDEDTIEKKLITKPISDSETNQTVITESVSESPVAPFIANYAAINISEQKIEKDNVTNPESQNIKVSSILTPIETRTENTKNENDDDIIDKKLITHPIPHSETNKTEKSEFDIQPQNISQPQNSSSIVNTVATMSPQQIIEQDNISNLDSQNSTLTPLETSSENAKNKSDGDIMLDSETNKTEVTESVSDTDKFKKSPVAPIVTNFTSTNISEQNIEQDNVSNPDTQNITASSNLIPIETSTENTKNKSDDDIIDKKLIKNPIHDLETNKSEISKFDIQLQNIMQPQNVSHDRFNDEESYNNDILPRNHEILRNNSLENISTTAEYISEKTSTEKPVTTTKVPVSTETKISNVPRSADKTYPESTSFSQDTDKADNSTGFWFEADEDFWDHIITRNETQNQFYFFFVPPKPSIEKETKTTVFANGTTIEEVIETITKDGEPKILKTTKITYANSTSVIV